MGDYDDLILLALSFKFNPAKISLYFVCAKSVSRSTAYIHFSDVQVLTATSKENSMSVFGAKSPLDLIEKIPEYSIYDIADKIRCPALLLARAKDRSFAGQAQKLYILFTTEEGAEDHCHVATLSLANQHIFDWLDEILEKRR